MNKQKGFSLLELTFVIIILVILAMFALPELTRTHREAKVAVLQDLRGKLINSVATLKTASRMESRIQHKNDQTYVQYDAKQYYQVSGETLHPSEICHILGLTKEQLVEGENTVSIDGMYTCKNEDITTSWVKMNKLESTDCKLFYTANYHQGIITAVDIKLVGDCTEL